MREKNINQIREWDIGYFDKNRVRRLDLPKRSIKQKLLAWELDQKYYDGSRENGYGGFTNDFRWEKLVPKLITRYDLMADGCVVDLGCKKGFILEAFKKILPSSKILGIENHLYPLIEASKEISSYLKMGSYWDIPMEDGSVDLVIAFSSIYMQNLGEIVKTLREIQRVSKGRSYITLGAYRNSVEREIFNNWTLIGTTVLHVDEWYEVMDYAGYTGDVFFTTPLILGLS